MPEELDPYHVWLGIPPNQQPPNHYRLLGIEIFESNEDVIDAAAGRQTAYLHQLASGPNRKASQKILNEVAAARRCLLNADARAAYDKKLKQTQPPATPASDTRTVGAAKKSSPSKPAAGSSPASVKASKKERQVYRCGNCETRLKASDAAVARGLTCPKCKTQIDRPRPETSGSLPPNIVVTPQTSDEKSPVNIDTAPSINTASMKPIAGRGKTKKPWWAHPAVIVGAGTSLILLMAFVVNAITRSDDHTSDVHPKSETATNVANANGVDPKNPIEPNPTDDFVLPKGKQSATRSPGKTAKTKPSAGKKSTAKKSKPTDDAAEDHLEKIVVDDKKAKKTGKWRSISSGLVGPGCVTTTEKKASISFPFTIPSTGPYEFRLRFRHNGTYATQVPVTIVIDDKPARSFRINMKQPSVNPGYKFLAVIYANAKQSGTVQIKYGHGNKGRICGDAIEIVKRKSYEGGILGYWSMDKPRTGKLKADIGMVVATTNGKTVPGVSGQGLSFRPGNELSVPVSMIDPNQGCISLWARLGSTGPVIFISAEGESLLTIRGVRSAENIQLRARLGKKDTPPIKTQQNLVIDRWYHLALVWTAEQTILYCDGRNVGSQTTKPNLKGISKILLARSSGSNSEAILVLDELRFYRRMLPQKDIAKLAVSKKK